MVNLSLNVEDCVKRILSKKPENDVRQQQAPATVAGPSTSSSAQNCFRYMVFHLLVSLIVIIVIFH